MSTNWRALAAVATSAALVACGSQAAAAAPTPGEDGRVDATPRALAALVIGHVDDQQPRRTTGRWSDWNDPLELEAQVDYGVDPEGTESGETRTVRISVADRAVYADDERWLHCRPKREEGRCEESAAGEDTVLYRWYPGYEEEESGSAGWTVVRPDEVVRVFFEGSDYYRQDPRNLDVGIDLDDLRAAAVDPAMSLRTTPEAWDAGAALDNYDGVEQPPEEPVIVPTKPGRLAALVESYAGIRAASVRRSRLHALGPDAVGARLRFEGRRGYDPFTIDILTTTGRAEQIDPLPCPVQHSREAAARACFAWDRDTVATWRLAARHRPGVLWIVGAQDDDKFNRVESVAIRVRSRGIVAPFFTERGYEQNRVPRDILAIAPLTSDLRVGPETRVAQ